MCKVHILLVSDPSIDRTVDFLEFIKSVTSTTFSFAIDLASKNLIIHNVTKGSL